MPDKIIAILFILNMLSGTVMSQAHPHQTGKKGNYVLVIHGGAGTLLKERMTVENETIYKKALEKALLAGYDLLNRGRTSLDAVQAAVNILEDDPHFNAGRGAVFTHDGRNEMDAAIMDGKTLKAGAVAGVTIIKNPVDAARAVMERSEHVMMAGQGAEKFARQCGLTLVKPEYFYTEDRWKALLESIKKDSSKSEPDHDQVPLKPGGVDQKFGTVGAVALDHAGNLAAATSTGGMTNKKYGRIGDTPIIGAGTYANNKTAAVSCTGWGEYFIRNVIAYDLSALMEYKHLSVRAAGDAVIKKLGESGGTGGLIALDKDGNMAMPFNTAGMYRASITRDGKMEIRIFRD
jgi:beta-aspartyl-peptidase (threonine type)